MRTKISRRHLAMSLCAAACVVLLVYAVRTTAAFPRWVVDDAFILFRYAENLVTAGELTFNPGENPVEGYTGLTHILLIAAAMKLGISPIAAAHGIGIASFFCGAVLIVLLLRGFNLGSTAALTLYLTAPFMYTHAWSGLETTLFCTAMLSALYTFTRRHRRLFIASVLLLSITRPEGALLSIILLALFRPVSLRLSLSYIVPAVMYFVWRLAYYGQLLPNTFYAKSLAGRIDRENIKMMRTFFSTYLPMPALLALIFVTWDRIREHKHLVIGVVAFSLVVLYNYLSSELMMNFSYRLLVPFYVLAIVTVGAIVRRARVTAKAVALVVLLIVPQAIKHIDKKTMKEERYYCRTHYQLLQDEHIRVGTFLNEWIPKDEWLIVHADAGAIPYYAKLKTVDFGKLNDEYLVQRELSDHDIVDYFYSHNAGVLVFTSYESTKLDHGPEADLITSDHRFGTYEFVKKYQTRARKRYYEFVYVRRDLLAGLIAEGFPEPAPGPGAGRGRLDLPGAGGSGRTSDMDPSAVQPLDGYAHEPSPAHAPSAEALWEKAESRRKPLDRITLYQKLADWYPNHRYAPQALFMIGFIYSEELKRFDLARECFSELIARYPEDEIVETAKWMIENMEKPIPDIIPPDSL